MPRVSCGASGQRTAFVLRLALCAALLPGGVVASAAESPAGASPSPSSSSPAGDAAGTPAPSASPSTPASRWDAPEPWRTDRFYLETSVYTRHFNSDSEHDNQQNLILGEWNITEQWLVGASFFDNSYGQPSQYVYGGFRWRPFDALQPLYVKVSAGLVHGYTGEYRDKIPLNGSGVAPVIVPSIGYCINRYCSELVVFGGAGLLLTFGVTIP